MEWYEDGGFFCPKCLQTLGWEPKKGELWLIFFFELELFLEKNSGQPRFHIKSEVSCGVHAPIFFQHVQGFSKERLGLTIPAQYSMFWRSRDYCPYFHGVRSRKINLEQAYTFCPTTVKITHRFCWFGWRGFDSVQLSWDRDFFHYCMVYLETS